jgi:hypothetical protein
LRYEYDCVSPRAGYVDVFLGGHDDGRGIVTVEVPEEFVFGGVGAFERV